MFTCTPICVARAGAGLVIYIEVVLITFATFDFTNFGLLLYYNRGHMLKWVGFNPFKLTTTTAYAYGLFKVVGYASLATDVGDHIVAL